MRHPTVDVPFGPFMLSQNETAQGLFIKMAIARQPPQEENEYLTPHIQHLLQSIDMRRFDRLSFDGSVRDKTWSIMAILK